MSATEAKYLYGTLRYRVSVQESLTTVTRKIYGSEEEKYVNALKELNTRFDWFSIKPGTIIEYLPVSVVNTLSYA